MSDKIPKAKAIKLIRESGGLISEYVNPGGRALGFSFGVIQLIDYCNWCDYETLKRRIPELKRKQ